MDEQSKLLNQLNGRDPYYTEDDSSTEESIQSVQSVQGVQNTPKILLSEQKFNPADMAGKIIGLVQEANTDNDFLKDVLAEMQVQISKDTIENLEEDMMSLLDK